MIAVNNTRKDSTNHQQKLEDISINTVYLNPFPYYKPAICINSDSLTKLEFEELNSLITRMTLDPNNPNSSFKLIKVTTNSIGMKLLSKAGISRV
jgi:hypothetical protein